ncbi:DMT family transporter [Shewanella sp. MMG014]|uniref:DMT family transporter n=1 Tax=Shewanella sp. MMG014 TaxID=2822691 RepID=UPI0032B46CBE
MFAISQSTLRSSTSKAADSLLKTCLLTVLAIIAFAANSVLSRLALAEEAIDAASFTAVRLITGALVLLIIVSVKSLSHGQSINLSKVVKPVSGSWFASIMLFIYAVTFSYAYISVDTGTGALILFGSVQLTMIAISLLFGTRLYLAEWVGILMAFSGLIYLVLPDVSSPSFNGFILMTLSGVAWGVYTLKGRRSQAPIMDTAYNFACTLPLVLVLIIVAFDSFHFTYQGIILAAIAGGLTSAVGYSIWYIALKGLSATQAAVIQLSVPIIAAIGGVIFVAEPITYRLMISSLVVLGGILTVVIGRYYSINAATKTTNETG